MPTVSHSTLSSMGSPLVLASGGLVLLGVTVIIVLRKIKGKRAKWGDDLPWCQVSVVERGSWPVEGAKKLKHFTTDEYATLCAICDTLIPAFKEPELRKAMKDYVRDLTGSDENLLGLDRDLAVYTSGAIDLNTPSNVAKTMEMYLKSDQLIGVRTLLRGLENPLGLLLFTGTWSWRKGFSQLPFKEREVALRAMFDHFLIPVRGFAQTCKAMVGRLHLSTRDETGSNKTWKGLEYEDRNLDYSKKVNKGKPFKEPKLKMEPKEATKSAVLGGDSAATDVREVTCDVVIVGSGAGGGVSAGVLATAGLDVVVLEKGPYVTERDFAEFSEGDGNTLGYDNGCWMGTEEASMHILAGSCVGGGTTINWCASFRTPKHVREEWSRRFGLKAFESSEFDESLEAVCRRVNVNTDHSHRNEECESVPDLVVNRNNENLWQGAKGVGAKCRPIPRNVDGCVDCSGCERGCPYGAKQSTMSTFLEDAQATGKCRIFQKAHVDKVIIDNGKAVGALVTVSDTKSSNSYTLIVWASKAVVAACGAIQTPALMLRSGLKHYGVGRNLALHPVAGAAALVPGRNSDMHKGVGMGTYVADYMNISGQGYGGLIETPPAHAGLTGVIVPWSNAFNYRAMCILKNQLAVYIPISRDQSSPRNRVYIDKEGNARISYMITTQDESTLQKTVLAMLRMLRTLNPATITPIHDAFRTHRLHREGPNDFEEYLKYVEARGLPVANAQMFSAHQMGSMRMAKHSSEGPLNEDGETWEVKDLYCMDASVFPTSLGVNPMITVESVAFMLARRLAKKAAGADADRLIAEKYLRPLEAQKGTKANDPSFTGDFGVSTDW